MTVIFNDMKVKGMIFAAGIGSRLRPITDTIPKALVEVGGEPMLLRTLMRMREVGIMDVVVNVHHHAGKIVEYLAQNDNFGMNIFISDESDELLDTGGGLLKAMPMIADADAVVLHNADIYTDIPLRPLIDVFGQSSADAVLAVNHRDTSRYLLVDSESRMRGWTNVMIGEVKPSSLTPQMFQALDKVGFCGIHVVNPKTLAPELQRYADAVGQKFSLTPFYIDHCNNFYIKCVKVPEASVWIDIGRPETLQSACESAMITYKHV